MPIAIKVGPPEITISQGRTFMVTNQHGEIERGSTQGVYSVDTRFVNSYLLAINRCPLQLINSSQISFYAARFHLTNSLIMTDDGPLPPHTLHITLDRVVSNSVYEEIHIENYAGRKVKCLLTVLVTSDFSDIFEVKENTIIQRGKMITEWDARKHELCTIYDNRGFNRAFTYCIHCDTLVSYANGGIQFEIDLKQGESWRASCEFILGHSQRTIPFVSETAAHTPEVFQGTRNPIEQQVIRAVHQGTRDVLDERQASWQARCPRLITSNYEINRMYQQAIEDMGALRIYDMDISDKAWVPAAGVPWFVTLFGRDSLLVAIQNIAIAPEFARGALRRLADFQAREVDDWRDAQPGKILHEARFGELATFHKIPFTPYYGTADATTLYLIALSMAYRWTGDLNLLKEFRGTAERCLEWIDSYGDLDGDGFQEYQTFSPQGYENIGWKDSWDAVVYADGTQVKQPKGLCELQGYVYDAKMRMSEMFTVLGEPERGRQLIKQAEDLKRRFNERFWVEHEGCYAYGLDRDKKQITTVSSNAGHCLWSGIADQEKAERTARRLLQDDMWSGWGIRTLTKNNPAYNPLSYHRGSIWPQDNAIIAAGFKRYGLNAEVNKVIRSIFDAMLCFDAYRPPEVFAGIDRRGEVDFPILFPGGANIPQAWATGAIFHMVGTLLGLRAHVPHRHFRVNPVLPEWLTDVRIEQLHVGHCTLDLHFWQEGERTRWEVERLEADAGTRPEDMLQVLGSEE